MSHPGGPEWCPCSSPGYAAGWLPSQPAASFSPLWLPAHQRYQQPAGTLMTFFGAYQMTACSSVPDDSAQANRWAMLWSIFFVLLSF